MRYLKQGKMQLVAGCSDNTTFARLHEISTPIQCVARELTPGPKGSGED